MWDQGESDKFLHVQSNLCKAAIQGNHKQWPLRAGGCLAEVNISTKLKFGNILVGCLIIQVSCLKMVTANSVWLYMYLKHLLKFVGGIMCTSIYKYYLKKSTWNVFNAWCFLLCFCVWFSRNRFVMASSNLSALSLAFFSEYIFNGYKTVVRKCLQCYLYADRDDLYYIILRTLYRV